MDAPVPGGAAPGGAEEQKLCCAPGGEHRYKEEKARIGPGVMASRVKQVILDLTVEKDKKDQKGEKVSKQSEEESHHLEEVENKKPGGSVRRKVRRLVPNFLWAVPNRHVDHNEGGEDVGRFVVQGTEVKRKSKEQQMRPYRHFRTPEPDNHYDFCLIP